MRKWSRGRCESAWRGRAVSSTRWRRRRSCQELFGDQGAEAIVLGDEFADELVQAALKNAVHAAGLQSVANSARLALCRSLPAIGAGDGVEIAHDRFVTRGERARHLIAQDQQVCD